MVQPTQPLSPKFVQRCIVQNLATDDYGQNREEQLGMLFKLVDKNSLGYIKRVKVGNIFKDLALKQLRHPSRKSKRHQLQLAFGVKFRLHGFRDENKWERIELDQFIELGKQFAYNSSANQMSTACQGMRDQLERFNEQQAKSFIESAKTKALFDLHSIPHPIDKQDLLEIYKSLVQEHQEQLLVIYLEQSALQVCDTLNNQQEESKGEQQPEYTNPESIAPEDAAPTNEAPSWKKAGCNSLKQDARGDAYDIDIDKIMEAITDDQFVEFMQNQDVIDYFNEYEILQCTDKSDVMTALNDWQDDFKLGFIRFFDPSYPF